MSEQDNKPKQDNEQQEDVNVEPPIEFVRAWNGINQVIAQEKLDISDVAQIGYNLLLHAALQSTDGDCKVAAELLHTVGVEELHYHANQLAKGNVTVFISANIVPILDTFDVKGKKPN